MRYAGTHLPPLLVAHRQGMKRFLWCLVPLALTACGTLPVGSAAIPDVQLTIPASLSLPVALTTPVVYLREDRFGGRGIPPLVNSVGVQGSAHYSGSGQVQQLRVYVRPSLDALPGCFAFTDYVVCFGDESAQAVGTIDFSRDNPTAVSLGGPALLNAARAGTGYFGLQATGRSVTAGDVLTFTNLRAVAKF